MSVTLSKTSRYDFVDRELERRGVLHRLRELRDVQPLPGGRVEVEGRILANFSSNDYLGLAFHPELKRRSIEHIAVGGSGSTGSRLVCGTSPLVSDLENKLANMKGAASALIFNSGFQANASLLPALCDRHSFVVMDRACHSSQVNGALASRATIRRYAHNDMDQLRDQLRRLRARSTKRIVVISESVFSMDGDRCDLPSLLALREEFDTFLIIDDAHGFGVLGPHGSGLACGPDVDLVVGTFGKACGSFGAFVTCSERLRSYLINCCSGFVASTALPPGVLGAVDAALDLVPTMDGERERLLKNAGRLLKTLRSGSWDCKKSSSQIVPVIVGGEQEVIQLAAWLEDNGIFAVPMRPPTVEQDSCRLRLTITAEHHADQVDHLAELLDAWRVRRS